MRKVMAPALGCLEVDGLSGKRYKAGRDGSYVMSNRDAKALVEWGGFYPSVLGAAKAAVGFRCTRCGFGAWFKQCSRCGGEAAREMAN